MRRPRNAANKYLGIDLIKHMVYNIGMDPFVALADPTRRQIIELLADRGELSARDISGRFSMSAPAISQHLKALRETNLVLMEKRGQQRIYRLNPDAMLELEVWIRRLAQRWNERFTALDAVLEELKGEENHDRQHSDQQQNQE
jgi:DNA-binding transcriptional ArsR family regulator